MNINDYKEVMREFYASIADFISNKPEIIAELKYQESFLKDFNSSEKERRKLIFDWYVFDYKSEVLSKNLLQYFLETVDIQEDLKDIYKRFKDSVFSIFEIKTLKIAKELIACDLATGKEYNIKDTALIQQIAKGQCGFLRLLPFANYYILTSTGFFFPEEANSFIKIYFMDIKNTNKPFKLTPITLCEIFSNQKKPEELPLKERFILFCQEAGLNQDYINEVIDIMQKKALEKADPYPIQKEIIAKIKPYPKFNMEEFTRALVDLWNSFLTKAQGYVEKGPIELALLQAAIAYLQIKLDLKKYKDTKKASLHGNQLISEWFKTPRQELGAKTPEEVIIEERIRLGNLDKRVGFKFNINTLLPGEEVFRKAEEAFNRGREFMKENKPLEAIEAYKEYISYNAQNHVVWCNLGIAYILILDKVNAQKCFKKALEIKPEYKLAKSNMRIIKNATKKDIAFMAKEYRVKADLPHFSG